MQLNQERRFIRAQFTDSTIRVYQAYSPEIAVPAIQNQKFATGFKLNRMTWIKPSFCWMMYRSNFAQSKNQEYILGIDITREGFEWALRNSVLSSEQYLKGSPIEWKDSIKREPVRIQWDPERNISLEKIDGLRAIQIGLSGIAVQMYVNDWITSITDVTKIASQAKDGNACCLQELGIWEEHYPVDPEIASRVAIN